MNERASQIVAEVEKRCTEISTKAVGYWLERSTDPLATSALSVVAITIIAIDLRKPRADAVPPRTELDRAEKDRLHMVTAKTKLLEDERDFTQALGNEQRAAQRLDVNASHLKT